MARIPLVGPPTRFLATREIGVGTATWGVVLDAVVSEGVIEQTVDRLLSSGVIDRVSDRVLAGPARVRAIDRLLDDSRFDAVLGRVLERTIDRLLAEGVVERLADRLLWARSSTGSSTGHSTAIASR